METKTQTRCAMSISVKRTSGFRNHQNKQLLFFWLSASNTRPDLPSANLSGKVSYLQWCMLLDRLQQAVMNRSHDRNSWMVQAKFWTQIALQPRCSLWANRFLSGSQISPSSCGDEMENHAAVQFWAQYHHSKLSFNKLKQIYLCLELHCICILELFVVVVV